MSKIIPIMAILIAWYYTYYQGIVTAIDIWVISEIFNHCFLVIPCALFLIYQKREQLVNQPFITNYWLLIPFIGSLILYTFGLIGDIRLFMHIATFVSLPLLIWLIIGNRATKIIAFPLYFMLFAIPFGEQLIPFLQELTTDIAVPLLEMTGVPIFRNGLYLDIPEGRFLVAEACSGISFLVASIVFGNIYAYISFKAFPKQLLFILISFLVPIIANALRVYGIVLTAHLTDMEYAAGADHVIYGGVFYSIVLFCLILMGEKFRDKDISLKKSSCDGDIKLKTVSNFWPPSTLIIVIFVMQYLWVKGLEGQKNSFNSKSHIVSFDKLPFDVTSQKLQQWQPKFSQADDIQQGYFFLENQVKTDFFIASYGSGKGELISSMNKLYDAKRWTLVKQKRIVLGNDYFKALFTELVSPQGQPRYIIHWYQMSKQHFDSKVKMKLYQTFTTMFGDHKSSAIVAFSVENKNNIQDLLNVINRVKFKQP